MERYEVASAPRVTVGVEQAEVRLQLEPASVDQLFSYVVEHWRYRLPGTHAAVEGSELVIQCPVDAVGAVLDWLHSSNGTGGALADINDEYEKRAEERRERQAAADKAAGHWFAEYERRRER